MRNDKIPVASSLAIVLVVANGCLFPDANTDVTGAGSGDTSVGETDAAGGDSMGSAGDAATDATDPTDTNPTDTDGGPSTGVGQSTGAEDGESTDADDGTSTADDSTSTSGDRGACRDGWADCDDDPDDCEADLSALSTCGSCDKNCDYELGESACFAGTCQVTVTIDELEDVTVTETQPDTNLHDSMTLNMDAWPSPDQMFYIRWALPEFPPQAEVTSANMVFDCFNTGGNVRVKRVETDWVTEEITLNNQPLVNQEILYRVADQFGEVVVPFDTALAQWQAGEPNYGLRIGTNNSAGITFHSSEVSPMDGIAPYVEISFEY